jgi:hypothetical protein
MRFWALGSKEESMSANDSQGKTSAYTFQGDSPADQYLEIARIHHLEAKQLLERSRASLAEDRQEEAKLLLDLSNTNEKRAIQFEKAARGECDDPIVAEIIDGLDESREKHVAYKPTFLTEEELLHTPLPEDADKPKLNPIIRALAWVGSWVTK